MKKIGLFVVLCTLAITAGAWGLDRSFVSQPFFGTRGVTNQTNYTSSALYVMLRSGKSNFTVCIDRYAYANPFNQADKTDYFSLLEQTLTPWITQVRKQIETSGRAAEFADILAWLPAQLTLTSTDCDKADIHIKVLSQRLDGRQVWAFDQTSGTWQVILTYGQEALAEAWKEIGSFWGLGVLTDTFQPQTVGEGQFKNTTDKNYSIYSVANSHPAPGASVMWWKQPSATQITCDDVEGFINAVDFVQFMEGETSTRLEKGWKSLCGYPYYYLRGRAANNQEELDAVRKETAQHRESGKALETLKKLLTQWDTYQQKQVLPVLTQYRKQLDKVTRPLDDNGLMLSAQVNHLNHVSDCAFHAIRRIKEYGANLQLCGGENCPALQEELSKLSCSPEIEPIKTPGLMETTPLEEDYPTGSMHTCASCGKSIDVKKERYDETYARHKKHLERYRYYRHDACPAVSADCAREYKDQVTQVQAPTYGQLLVRSQLVEFLSTKKGIDVTAQPQVAAPAVQQPVVASAGTKKKDVSMPLATKKGLEKHEHSVAVGVVKPGEDVHCSVCGEKINAGDTYYKRTESQFMHRHGQCAYSFFTKKHNVDEESLASYARTYSFKTPAEVASALADMKVLGLSIDTVRQLRMQEDANWQQQAEQKLHEQARQQAREQLNTQCRVYLKVTAQDVARFKQVYAKQLRRIEQKEAKHQKLTRQQARLQKQYKQLLRDERKAQECLALEQAAR